MTTKQENQVMAIFMEMMEEPDLDFELSMTPGQVCERDDQRTWARIMCLNDNS